MKQNYNSDEKTIDIIKKASHDPMFRNMCIFLALTAVCAVLVSLKSLDRHTVQMIYLAGAVFLLLFLRSLLKLMKKYFGTRADGFFRSIGKKLAGAFSAADRRLRRLLHLPEKKYIYDGEDERDYGYRFTKEEKKERSRVRTTRLKWKNIDENKIKIRFLYVRYVSEAIAHGYKFKYSSTARDIKADVAKDERQKLLYDLYEDVRYRSSCGDISDEVIEYLNENG